MMEDNRTTPGPMPGAAQATNTPPLFNALIKAFKKDAVVTVSLAQLKVPIFITHGRVINVRHERTSFQSVVDLLVRTGLLSRQDVSMAEREARRMATSLEDSIVTSGLVSEGTLESAQEMLCLEVLLDLLLRTNIEISVDWAVDPDIREMCTLPIRFLLREAQKRSIDLPKVKRVVPSSRVVFSKTAALSGIGGAQSWADLPISAADRQVYFFVDGNRNVAELALASCQSEFKVAKALMSLVDNKLIRRLAPNEPRSATSQVPTQAIGKWAALVVTCILLVGFAAGVRLGMGAGDPTGKPSGSGAYESVVGEASARRLSSGARQYHLIHGKAPESFDDLLRERLVRRADLTVSDE